MPLNDDIQLGFNVLVDPEAIVGYAWKDPAPPTLVGEGSRIRAGAIIYAGVVLGDRTHIGHGAVIRQGTKLGDDCSIGTNSVVEHNVTIGNRVRIHSSSFIPEETRIADDAWIGPMVCITNARYPMLGPKDTRLSGVTIEQGAKIGGGSVLLPGVVIGVGALVGAGSVVTKSLEPGGVYAGNPARKINDVDRIKESLEP